MRLNTPEEVLDWARKAAASDLEKQIKHGVDLNPYCTQDARNCWQRGFDNKGPRSYDPGVEFDYQYQRGRAAAILVEAQCQS